MANEKLPYSIGDIVMWDHGKIKFPAIVSCIYDTGEVGLNIFAPSGLSVRRSKFSKKGGENTFALKADDGKA